MVTMCSKREPWRYCLSLGAAAWTHSFILAVAGAWNLLLFLNVFPWKRSLTEAAVEAYAKRSTAVASALRVGFLSLAIIFLMVSVLTDIALCLKSRRVAYVLAWINICSSFVGLILLLYLWTAFGIMLLSVNATVGELVVWGNVDLLYVILTAVPMTKIYASLGNVYAAGGTGFEGKSFEELVSPQKKTEILSERSLKMSRIGNWRVGLSLEHGAVLWSLFCLAITILDLSIFWVKISDDPMVKMNQMGIIFLVEGITAFFAAISALAGSAAGAPFFALLSAIITVLVLPLAVTLLVMLSKRLILEVGARQKVLILNFASLHAMGAQIIFIFLAFFATSALCGLFNKQTKKELDSGADRFQRVDLEEESQKLLSVSTEP
ncbi:hypothetical protein cyc_01461 [Cyclospora cayetanensis]|uniref:Transmembrane protein n=1 Tax=Cyclospora cayetanensis TaxID=88456 RepID=A0A1D3CR44_9EIME|nr:hypothetical protein cyc_01461 [Cyclospora cayetanensis]